MKWSLIGSVVCALAVSAGCANRREPFAPTTRSVPSAARIYTVAEAHVEAGAYPQAVLLLRHAILQLPETKAADELRHKLILRLAYAQLLAHHQTRDIAYLADAKTMLSRYLERHEGLFGTMGNAEVQRGEVYEILYEVESRLEPEPEPESESETESDGSEGEARMFGEADAPGQPTKRLDTDGPGQGELGSQPTYAGQELQDSEYRVIRVSTRDARLEDAEVQARFRSNFSDPHAGLVLTKGGFEEVHGPRGLVRLYALPYLAGSAVDGRERRSARRLGYDVLRAARPALRKCYEHAFARNPTMVADSVIELSVLPSGDVKKVRVIDGGVIDGLGDVCVIENLQRTKVDSDNARVAMRVRLPLRFFHQGAVYMDEARGRSMQPDHHQHQGPAPVDRQPMPSMPPIDDGLPPT